MRRAALVLAVVLAAAGPPEPDGYRLDDYRAPVPDTVAGGEVVHLDAMRALVGQAEVVLIDVLPAPRRPESMRAGMPWLPAPHRSLPGAVWWPDVGRGALAPALEAGFRDHLQSDVGQRLVVFFCLSNCWMSWNAAKRAASWGYRVGWYPEGVDGWEAAGLTTVVVAPQALD